MGAPVRITVGRERLGERLDRFLTTTLTGFSRSRIQSLIHGGFITLNGRPARPRDPVRPGDRIQLIEPAPEKVETLPQDIPLDVIYEDDDLIVVNKQPGLVVHPGAANRDNTLVNALLHHCKNLSGIGGKERPGIVHRLDKETSGCLVAAKNDEAHQSLAKQFASRTIDKLYLALVAGILRDTSGTIEAPIARHAVHRQRMSVEPRRGRIAKTEYRVLRAGKECSLVECKLHTGRTHQIRVHLHYLGHPILGDKVYGARLKDLPRQMLHAWKLEFVHPRTKERKLFEAPVPQDFTSALKLLELN